MHDSTSSLKRAIADTIGYTDGKRSCSVPGPAPLQASKRAKVKFEPLPQAGEASITSGGEQPTHDSFGEVNGPSVKATKNDDAKVNERHWDTWSVDNFQSETGRKPLICVPGSYCEASHGRLFGSLRKLAIRWYRRKILKSFLNYLRRVIESIQTWWLLMAHLVRLRSPAELNSAINSEL